MEAFDMKQLKINFFYGKIEF